MVEEQVRAARDGCALADLSDRALLAVTGPLRVKFLHNILSNDVQSLAAGGGCRAALMDVKGHLLATMRVLVGGDTVLLELPAPRRDHVRALLDHYRVGAPVRFAPLGDAVMGLFGPGTSAVLGSLGVELPALAPESHVTVELAGVEVRIVRAGDLPAGGHVVHVSETAAPELARTLSEAGAVGLGRDAVDVLRVEDGRPWYGIDIGEENLLHETGLLHELHSSTKGCYVGQEVVARLEGRGGNVNRALRGLRLGAPARAGARITADDRDVGSLTTAVVSPRLGPIAMGYVHRSRFEPGTEVSVDGTPATVSKLPFVAP